MYENIKIVKVNYHETLLGTASYLAVSSPARRAALAGRSSAGAVQAVCNGPSMSAAQSTTSHTTDCCIHTSDIARRQHLRSTAAISCSYRDTGVRSSVVGRFLWPTRRSGTRYKTTCEIRRVPWTVFAPDLKNFAFLVLLHIFTTRFITQRITGFAIMRYINLLLTMPSVL